MAFSPPNDGSGSSRSGHYPWPYQLENADHFTHLGAQFSQAENETGSQDATLEDQTLQAIIARCHQVIDDGYSSHPQPRTYVASVWSHLQQIGSRFGYGGAPFSNAEYDIGSQYPPPEDQNLQAIIYRCHQIIDDEYNSHPQPIVYAETLWSYLQEIVPRNSLNPSSTPTNTSVTESSSSGRLPSHRCLLCQRTTLFTTRGALKQHINQLHYRSSVYLCPALATKNCDYEHSRLDKVNEHCRNNHPDFPQVHQHAIDAVSEFPSQCTLCPNTPYHFHSWDSWWSHFEKHCRLSDSTEMASRTPFHDAARAGSRDIVDRLHGVADVETMDGDDRTPLRDGRTPLHDAAHAGLEDTIYKLLSEGADVNAVDKNGRTPLHDAARTGSEDIVGRLLNEGADVKAVDKDSRTALYYAVSANKASVICLLVHLGAGTCDLDEYGLAAFRRSFSPLGVSNSKDAALLTIPNSIVQCSTLYWDGLRTYDESKGDIGNVLTISRTKSQGHSYTARSVSEYLADIHPTFGLPLLEWIKGICAACIHARSGKTSEARLRPQSSHFMLPSHSGPEKSVDTPLSSSSSYQNGVIITGLLEAQKLTLLVSAESEASMSEVKSALAWLLAVLQPRPENVGGVFYLPLDQNMLEEGIPEPIEFKPEKLDRYCWMELFSYVVIVESPLPAEVAIDVATEGLEIELSLLMELAAIDRQATINGGVTMMYGFDTAIVPLEPAEAKRWHFMTTTGRQITPRRAESELAKRKLDTMLLASQYIPGKVYIGWCPNPVVKICSQALDTFAGEVIRPSGVPPAERLEERSERSTGKDCSFSPRFGFLGSSLSFSAGAKRENTYIRCVVIAARRRQKNFEGILTSAMGTPSILWDSRNQRAFFLPVISVLAFASLRYIEWAKYTFIRKQNGKDEKAGIYYSVDMRNTGCEARTVLRRNSSLVVDTANGDTANGNTANDEPIKPPLTFEDIARDIWEYMCDGEDVCVSKLSGTNHQDEEGIFGYDLSEAMYQRTPQLRKLQCCLPAMRSWMPLCQGHRLQVIFSQYVGEVLNCNCYAADGLVTGQGPPRGSLTCLLDDLRSFYGANWNVCEQDSYFNGLPVGKRFEWIPRGHVPGEGHGPCSRRIFESITEKQNKKLKRKRPPKTTPDGRAMDASSLDLPRDQRLICFAE